MMVFAIVVFQGLVFLGMILIMRQFMKGHVSGAVGHLQKLNEDLSRQQADLKAKIAAAEKEYAEKIAKVQQEVSAKQAEARIEAAKFLDDSRARAQAEREKLINEAVGTRDKIRQEIMAEMDEKAIAHAKNVIAECLSPEMRKLLHQELVREVAEGLAELNMNQFQLNTEGAELKLAEPLTAEERKNLQALLREKIKKDVPLKEEIQPELLGGLILRFGTLIVDASLSNRLKEAAAKLKKETARRYQGTM